jgi:hypothetical protein
MPMITPKPKGYKPEPPNEKDSWLVWYLIIGSTLISIILFSVYIKYAQ